MPEPNVPINARPIAQYGRNLVINMIAMPNRSPANSSTDNPRRQNDKKI